MKRKKSSSKLKFSQIKIFLILLFIPLCYFLITPKNLLFYDAVEYVNIVGNNSFLHSLFLGHPPIRPFFMAILWLMLRATKILFNVSADYSGNLTAFFLGSASVFIFYKLTGYLIEGKPKRILAVFLFSLLPGVWLINTNLMVESLVTPLFILVSICFLEYLHKSSKITAILLVILSAMLFCSHLQTVAAIPAVLGLFFLLNKQLPETKRKLLFGCLLILAGLLLSLVVYASFFAFLNQPILENLKLLFFGRFGEYYTFRNVFLGSALLGRNILLNLLKGFGSVTVITFAILGVMDFVNNPKHRLFTIFLLFSIFILGSVWGGDYMPRRIVYLGAFLILFLSIKLKIKYQFLLLGFLISIFVFNIPLYFFNRKDMPLVQMAEMQNNLVPDNLLIQTHYLRPFTGYKGDILWVGQSSLDVISKEIKKKKVFLDSQAIFAPYLLYVGNNLHITSLNKIGKSETESLFISYSVNLEKIQDSQERIFTYSLIDQSETLEQKIKNNRKFADAKNIIFIGKAKSGFPVFVYSNELAKKIHRERVDYGDVFSWVWALAFSKTEPLFWTYADKNGLFVLPLPRKDEHNFRIKAFELDEIITI